MPHSITGRVHEGLVSFAEAGMRSAGEDGESRVPAALARALVFRLIDGIAFYDEGVAAALRERGEPAIERAIAGELRRMRRPALADPDAVAAALARALELDLDLTPPEPLLLPVVARPHVEQAVRYLLEPRAQFAAEHARLLLDGLEGALDRVSADAGPLRARRGELEARLIDRMPGWFTRARHPDHPAEYAYVAQYVEADLSPFVGRLFEVLELAWDTSAPPPSSVPARAYSPRERYAVGEAIEHPRFGRGVVTEVTPTSVTVRFVDTPRALRHGAS